MREFKYPLDGTYMNVITFGSGAKHLAILSGVSLCGLEGKGPAVEPGYREFLDQYTVWLFDRKKVLPQGYTVAQLAEDVYRVLKAQGVEQADLYGVSQGGMMAQELALAHPEFVGKMALASTCSRLNEHSEKVVRRWLALAEAQDVRAMNHEFFTRVYTPGFLKQFEAVLPALEAEGTPEDCDRFAILMRSILAFSTYDRLPQIKCPAIILGAELDDVLTAAGSVEMADRLGCPCYIARGYGHAAYDEAPEYKEKLRAFLLS